MGMFDWVDVEYDLGEYNFLKEVTPAFQTKNLYNCMIQFIFSAEGRLLWLNRDDTNFPFRMNFYKPYGNEWYEFEVEFDRGQATSIMLSIGPCPFNMSIKPTKVRLL